MPHSLWKDRPLPSRPLLARYPCLPLVALLTACLQGFLKGQNDWSRPSALLEVHRQLCVQTPYKPFEVKVCLLVFWQGVSNDEQVSICCASEKGLSIMCRCLFFSSLKHQHNLIYFWLRWHVTSYYTLLFHQHFSKDIPWYFFTPRHTEALRDPMMEVTWKGRWCKWLRSATGSRGTAVWATHELTFETHLSKKATGLGTEGGVMTMLVMVVVADISAIPLWCGELWDERPKDRLGCTFAFPQESWFIFRPSTCCAWKTFRFSLFVSQSVCQPNHLSVAWD